MDGKFRKRVHEDLKSLPNAYLHYIQGQPDFILCLNSMFVIIGLKNDDEEVDSYQEKKMTEVTRARGIVIIAKPKNWNKAFELLSEVSCSQIDVPGDFTLSH